MCAHTTCSFKIKFWLSWSLIGLLNFCFIINYNVFSKREILQENLSIKYL